MSLLAIRENARRRRRDFTPGWVAKSGYGRLEARALTAPMIYRRPPTDPLEAMDGVSASALGQTTDSGVSSAAVSGTVTNSTNTVSILQQAGINVWDAANPGAPAPTGTEVVCFCSDVTLTNSGGSGFFPTGTASTSLTRNYVLADDTGSAGTTPAVVTETYTMDYDWGAGSLWTVSLDTPGMKVSGNGSGLTITIPGFMTPLHLNTSGSGTNTSGSVSYSYTFTATPGSWSLTLTDSRSVGILPGAGTNPDGTAKGLSWPVTASSLVSETTNTASVNELSTHYRMVIS